MNRPEKNALSTMSPEEHQRRKRERILIVVITAVAGLLAMALNRKLYLAADFSVSNQVLIFILININLLLLLLLIFLVFRNLVKLLYDRKRKVMGAKLRTKLVIAFVCLTLLPATILFVFSINFITGSIEFWFNVPVEQALENSLKVGQDIYQRAQKNNKFFLERISYQISKKELLKTEKIDDLTRYITIVQREFNLSAIEVYDTNAKRIAYAISENLESRPFDHIGTDDLQKPTDAVGIHNVVAKVDFGELIRTIGRVPFGVEPTEAQAFVAISAFVPEELAASMSSIARGYEEYQQVKLLKQPIQSYYYITLTVVGLLVVFCAVWLGFYLAKSITIPIMRLAEGTRRVAEGDLSFALDEQADDEIGSLVSAFNKMTADLRISREQLELSAQMLRKQNIEIEERRRYMEIVLKNVSAGVITLDAGGLITTFNTAAEKMLAMRSENILNKSYRDLLSELQFNLEDGIIKTLASTPKEGVELPLRLSIDNRPRSFLAYVNSLKDETDRNVGTVIVIDDLTELEKAQRMAAWREVARRIAHEVKNPLTPITLSAQRLKRKYSLIIKESVFDECTQMIINHVELIRNLVNEFSTFARFPTANPKPCELPPIIDETVALYREGHPNIEFKVSIQDEIPSMSLDYQQIKQAMINLVDNAVAAIRSRGTVVIEISHDPILNRVRIEVADDGIGISDEDKIRLFEPNFSTKKAGMGLGLTIVNSIVTDHNGVISVQGNQPRGAKFVIELPTKDR
jgi:two-component system nitrogen regulation sensor histidine kinase NtrY